eukprot:tig00020961_g16719.t1
MPLCCGAAANSRKLPFSVLKDETEAEVQRLEELTPAVLLAAVATQRSADDLELDASMKALLVALNARGLLTLLGVRKTPGSIDVCPPPVSRLRAAAAAAHCEREGLSVGARALSKHSHRGKECWWGTCSGPTAAKNAAARQLFERLLADVPWLNVHVLPHDVRIMEIRTRDGYGARWLADGSQFRGFLEPPMEDGHERGWRH